MAAYSFNGFEMESFIGKFLYLSLRGYESNLHLTSSNESISVSIQANLGSINPQCETVQRNVKLEFEHESDLNWNLKLETEIWN